VTKAENLPLTKKKAMIKKKSSGIVKHMMSMMNKEAEVEGLKESNKALDAKNILHSLGQHFKNKLKGDHGSCV
jgi:hypothetical protein